MNLKQYHNNYSSYLKIERALSNNTIESYLRDVKFFLQFIDEKYNEISITAINSDIISEYLINVNEQKKSKPTQSRIISSLRSFFKYLKLEKIISESPMDMIDLPQLDKHLPDVLSIEDVNKIIDSIDLSLPNGQRNRAIIEMLYGCGLRVSELINLRVSDIDREVMFIKVKGKGNKERLVPLGKTALKQVEIYLDNYRLHINPSKKSEDILFLNRRGGKLSREMIFIIVKELTEKAGIKKNISPHTFRHSFATHMIQRGADIRIVQDMLGHESILTTEIYTHINKQHLRDVVDKYHPLNDL
ncbi:site-specific tyrosine recombinase XerD [Bacteroidales bacterium OttesenSCG-928-K03]|nr:site-specific tyrosine recombinase XerD [Odoribacter sp. OttesenSCG-928-L07]MDL2243084.1 site-specific tyrosine recombinase XerD [Bacteroidales bacterium OttesenSCG-928-K03]